MYNKILRLQSPITCTQTEDYTKAFLLLSFSFFTAIITLQRYNMEKRLSRTFFFNFIYNSLIFN